MKFKVAVFVSVILHLSLFALALYMPTPSKHNGTTYYVDLVNMPGGGGGDTGGGGNQAEVVESSGSVRDLTVKKEPPKAKLRYPEQDKKNKQKQRRPKKKKKQQLVSVVKKKDPSKKTGPLVTTTRRKGGGSNSLRTGISAGKGNGSGSGSGGGSGDGFGSGIGSGNFPYAYYIQTLRNKISSSWYSALVSPGLKGKHAAIVYFRILRNGKVSDLRLETRSGNESLDLSALRAIKEASPFPPLPNDFVGGYLGVHFEFEWER